MKTIVTQSTTVINVIVIISMIAVVITFASSRIDA
jgi:hypothetical protein